MSNKQSMVIVGAGCAGTAAALGLRERGWDGEIVLLGDEAELPYERPPLSKASLVAEPDPGPKHLVTYEELAERGISFRPGLRASAIDAAAKVVALSTGETLAYHRLLLATGARPRRLTIPVSPECRTMTLRTYLDAKAIRKAIHPGSEIVVVGGGFIGLEVAASATVVGARVTLLEAGPRLLMRAVPEPVAETIRFRHAGKGVRILTDAAVERIEAAERRRSRVVLADGRTLTADLVIVGIGAVPNVELACSAGLRIDNGILADEKLQTSDPEIFAAGDCCSYVDDLYGKSIRLEAWRNAQRQGSTAAASMLGGTGPYDDVPWFWSDQYEETLQMVGLIHETDTAIRRSLGSTGEVLFYLNAEGHLAAACGFGELGKIAKEIRFSEALIKKKIQINPSELLDASISLKKIIQDWQEKILR